MDKITFGRFIANTRRELGMTQLTLAEKLYVTDKAVSKWERGLCYPDLVLLEQLASVLGLTVEELMACEKHQEGTSLAGCYKTDMSSILEIANESQKHRRKKIWTIVGLLALSFALLTSLIFYFIATNMNDSHDVTFIGKKANADGSFVYVEKDGRLLRLHCPDRQMYDSIEPHKEWAYQIEYCWNFFTYQGTLKSCQEKDTDDLYLGTPMDTLGSAFIVDSLLGIRRVKQTIKNVYPDPERDGKYLKTYCFSYEQNGYDIKILTVEDCRSVALADYDDDGVTELFVLTKYAEEPYMLYDIEKGTISSVFVDEVPADVLELLKIDA